MTADVFLFWFLSAVVLISGISVVALKNPIYSALCLAMTMVSVAALFVTLDAHFLAGVQVIVYAGAVMVLFVMVLMLFDLKEELKTFSSGSISTLLKLISVGSLAGLIIGGIVMTASQLTTEPAMVTPTNQQNMEATKNLGVILFTQNVFQFEILGILLLVIAVGVVALARSKGGTHAQH